MKTRIHIVAVTMIVLASFAARASAALPGQEQIEKCASAWLTRAQWESKAGDLRKAILGPLAPWPAPTALNPIWREKIVHDEYTVQPLAFESMPGFYCCADLYMPAKADGKRPAIIRAHGHGPSGRYGTQAHCAAMARMGAVVLSVSMVGYNDAKQYCVEHTKEHQPGPAVATLQLL